MFQCWGVKKHLSTWDLRHWCQLQGSLFRNYATKTTSSDRFFLGGGVDINLKNPGDVPPRDGCESTPQKAEVFLTSCLVRCKRKRLAGEAIPVGIQSLPKDNFLFHGSIFSCQGIIFVEKRFEPIMCLTNHRSLLPFSPCCWLPQECHIFMDAADRSASVGSAAGKFYSNQPGLNRAMDAKWAMKKTWLYIP